MRRSGSSCLLRPKDSMDSADNNQLQEPLSVTMISREELPSYSTERFFMLSEFHLNAHSIRFVPEIQDSDETTPETVDTSTASSSIENNSLADFPPENVDSFPSYLLFYVLWRPDMTTSVTSFTTEVILKAVKKIQSHVEIALSDEDKKRPREGPMSPSRNSNNNNNNESESSEAAAREHDSVTSSLGSADNGKTRLYLVVERTVPYRDFNHGGERNDNDSNHNNNNINQRQTQDEDKEKQRRQFEVEAALAERLARHVASHSELRSLFQGITIGVANHKRAAPGLDACLDVINLGAKDRRKIGRDARSHVGLIAMSADDLLGLDEEGETDAAQDVLQTRISTEWNGKGNLKSFGYRAHAMWRKDHGMPPHPSEFPLKENKRRTGRRLSRLDEELGRLDSFPLDLLLNLGAFLLIAYYVWKGFVGDPYIADQNV